MNAHPSVFDHRRLLVLLWLLLTLGFAAISLIGYQVSIRNIRAAIVGQDLPLTSSNIYSEIQKDLVRPVLISSTMAHDTFLRDWVLHGEKDAEQMARFLREVKLRHGAFSSFFVSERSQTYYTGEGVLKRVSSFEPRDAWYFRVRGLSEDYEINVDPDLANADKLTIFINYRVFDYRGNFLGATGVGLTIDAVRRLVEEYQQRFSRTIYFADPQGTRIEFGNRKGAGRKLQDQPGLGALMPKILAEKRGSFRYEANGETHVLQVNYLPELKWYLFVEQNETVALADVRRSLYANLAISLFVTLIVTLLIHIVMVRHQRHIEQMASTDKLTGLLNRHAFNVLIAKLLSEYRRDPKPFSVVLADIDHFKTVNDRHGHSVGDAVLKTVSARLQNGLRESDLAVRWGGEEFLLVLKGCARGEAERIAENLRAAVMSEPIIALGRPLEVTISLGVGEFDGEETEDKLIDRADQALYRAKKAGRNRVEAG